MPIDPSTPSQPTTPIQPAASLQPAVPAKPLSFPKKDQSPATMEPIYQTDPYWDQYKEDEHEWCFFLSIIYLVAWKLSVDCWHHDTIQQIWSQAELFHDLDADGATVLDTQALADLIAGPGRITYMGSELPTYQLGTNEAEILCWHIDGATYNHFVVGDGNHKVAYDPWDADGSAAVKRGSIINTRIWKIT
jgi:hypothetical protein